MFWHVLLRFCQCCKYNVRYIEICHNFWASRVVFKWMEFLKLLLFVDIMQENCLLYISYTFFTWMKQVTEGLYVIYILWTNYMNYLDKVVDSVLGSNMPMYLGCSCYTEFLFIYFFHFCCGMSHCITCDTWNTTTDSTLDSLCKVGSNLHTDIK